MPASASKAATIAMLREHIARVAPARSVGVRLSTGLSDLDRRVGGWPHPGMAEVCGMPGTGRLALVLPVILSLTAQRRTVAIVDAQGWLNPVGLTGAVLDHILVVRPGPARVGWATEQLARSGAVPLVLVLDPPALRRAGRRIVHAAEAGDTAVIVVSERPEPELPVALRIELCGPRRARVTRGGRLDDSDFTIDDPTSSACVTR